MFALRDRISARRSEEVEVGIVDLTGAGEANWRQTRMLGSMLFSRAAGIGEML